MSDTIEADENVLPMAQADQMRLQILLRIISYARAMRPEELYSRSLVLGNYLMRSYPNGPILNKFKSGWTSLRCLISFLVLPTSIVGGETFGKTYEKIFWKTQNYQLR